MTDFSNVRIVEGDSWVSVYINGEKFFEDEQLTLSDFQDILEELGHEVDHIESYGNEEDILPTEDE